MIYGYITAGIFLFLFTSSDNLLFCIIGRVSLVLAINTTWIATPEMYDTDVRATGHGAANLFSRLGALIASVYLVREDVNSMVSGERDHVFESDIREH